MTSSWWVLLHVAWEGPGLMADEAEARVFPGNRPEIGFGRVHLTPEGNRDPVLGSSGRSFPVFHWHGDTFDLPAGATLLASSTECPHQAFRFGRCAYGLQFHVEPNASTWTAWRPHLPAALIDEAKTASSRIEQIGRKVIAGFFDVAQGKINNYRGMTV